MGRQLLAEKRIALVHKAAFSIYCVAWGRWCDAEKELFKSGTTRKTPSGYMEQSPHLSIANTAMGQLTKALTHLGLSPTSQAKVSKVKQQKSTLSRLELFQGGKTEDTTATD